MNLYRSFGNLMEAWVTDGGQSLDSEWLGSNDGDLPTPSSDVGSNLRSESVDSGVETASSVMSSPATPCSIWTDNAEIDTFSPEREGDGLTPASTSPVLSSPSPSSSSLQLSPCRSPVGSTASPSKVEQALQKTDSKRQKNKQAPLTVDEMLKRRPRTPFLSKQHASELVRGQRSESLNLRRTAFPSLPMRQLSETCVEPPSTSCDKQPAQARSEACGEEAVTLMSPGLCYLEQVCQMLEEIARKQMRSRAIQTEMDALREHENMELSQAVDTCQTPDFKAAAEEDLSSYQTPDFKAAAEENLSSYQSLENTQSAEQSPTEPQQRKDSSSRHFRQRSASDTNISTMHLRKLNANCRGQHLSTDDLLEKEEEEHEKQGCDKEETIKTNRNWKLPFGYFTRDVSSLRETKGQQMQSSEKNSARRRLSQLFRRRKTVPV
ncbi:uncharacterized protein LOC141757000 [Sebastes fasciatus]|uniref:uncharacterized protein LOC141757000 n=1 Tax=Sebastes fasciatus TaxID=394691 RepID=UPI003D9F9D93